MAKYNRGTVTTVIYGRKFNSKGNPIPGCLVTLFPHDAETRLAVTSTDKNGRWLMSVPTVSLPCNTYHVRFYGSGVVQKLPPYGDWEIMDIPVVSSAALDPVGITYAGTYDPTRAYYGVVNYKEIVRYRVANVDPWVYYICTTSTPDPAGTWDLAHWSTFGNNFRSVATDILFAQDVAVGRTITLGTLGPDGGSQGVLKTANVSGLFAGDGVWLADATGGEFRVGEMVDGALSKGILWDGTNFSVKAANVEITASGYLWANAGGFGGVTSALPVVLLDSTGLTIPDGDDPTISRVFITDNNALWSNQAGRATELSVLNPGFEASGIVSGDAENWTFHHDVTGTVTRSINRDHPDELGAHTGEYCLLMCTDPGWPLEDNNWQEGGWACSTAVSTGITTLRAFSLSFWFAIYGEWNDIDAAVEILNTTDEVIKKFSLPITAATTVWTEHIIGFSTNLTAVKIRFTMMYKTPDHPVYSNGLYIDDVSLSIYEPFLLMSSQGLFAFNSPGSYLKFGDTGLVIKGAAVEVQDMIVMGNLYAFGTTYSAANNLAGTTSPLFVIGTTTAGSALTRMRLGNYTTTNELASTGSDITSSVPFKAPSLLANNVAVATSYDLDMEMMRMNFQQVSWAQFAIMDSFDDSSKRDPVTPGNALLYLNELSSLNATANAEFEFNSKTYSGITTVLTGTGTGTTNTFTIAGTDVYFTDELRNLTLRAGSDYTVVSSANRVLTVVGTPTTGAFSLVDGMPSYLMAFMSFQANGYDGTGYVKFEFSPTADFATNRLVLFSNIPADPEACNHLTGVVKLSTYGITPGSSYKVRITLKNDPSGYGPKIHRFLVATDPSPWRW